MSMRLKDTEETFQQTSFIHTKAEIVQYFCHIHCVLHLMLQKYFLKNKIVGTWHDSNAQEKRYNIQKGI